VDITTWWKVSCLTCDTANWLNQGDVTDMTVPDVEGFRCWSCEALNNILEDRVDEVESDDVYYVDGLPEPV